MCKMKVEAEKKAVQYNKKQREQENSATKKKIIKDDIM